METSTAAAELGGSVRARSGDMGCRGIWVFHVSMSLRGLCVGRQVGSQACSLYIHILAIWLQNYEQSASNHLHR